MSLDLMLMVTQPTEVYGCNYTHNITPMAKEAGIYQQLWRPENGSTAGGLIVPLKNAITLMRKDRPRFQKLNPDNGWGDYDSFLSFLESLLRACEEDPEAFISVGV